jgi:transposase-like protein
MMYFHHETGIKKGADMKKVLQLRGKGKTRKAKAVQVRDMQEYGAMELDSRLALIQELIPIGLMHVEDELRREVMELAGEKYKRNGLPGHDRWGRQQGSIYIQDQRIPIIVPRVRDTRWNEEVTLRTYEQMQAPGAPANERLLRRILHGLSCSRYRECSEAIPEALSLSRSTVSRRYIRASKKKLQELIERRLDGYDLIGIVLDGKRFGDDGIIIAIGITMGGEKILLGIIQSGTENHVVCRDFLLGLIDRGMKHDQGLLCVIDGAKGFRKAINEVFGSYGIIQRCQWHKRENIVEYLPKSVQTAMRRKLQAAYEHEDYAKARTALMAIKKELRLINESAVASLEEGFEESLTVQRLGLSKELRKSLKTTNVIESVLALVGQKTDKVDYWKNSNQKQRWVATALLDIEPRLNRISGYRKLKSLRAAIQKELTKAKGKEAVAA